MKHVFVKTLSGVCTASHAFWRITQIQLQLDFVVQYGYKTLLQPTQKVDFHSSDC